MVATRTALGDTPEALMRSCHPGVIDKAELEEKLKGSDALKNFAEKYQMCTAEEVARVLCCNGDPEDWLCLSSSPPATSSPGCCSSSWTPMAMARCVYVGQLDADGDGKAHTCTHTCACHDDAKVAIR